MLIICAHMADELGFLIADVSRLLRRRFDERARSIGITRPQWRALAAIRRAPGLNQGALAERLDVEPITACRMIDRLEDAGLVERRRDPDDRRAWLIHLTKRAEPLTTQLRALADDMFASVLADISDADRQQITDTLTRIRDNIATPEQLEEAANG